MKLYFYYRSSCSYRLRIALQLKQFEYDYVAVNLLNNEQLQAQYTTLNPLGLVPALEVAEGEILGQSVALLEWLDETHPLPPLLPSDPLQRARVRALVNTIACDIQPICNLSIIRYLQQQQRLSDQDIKRWLSQWMSRGFQALEPVVAQNNQPFCFGDTPGMADLFLVPQIYNARRMQVDITPFPHLTRVVDHCNELPAFIVAAPENQPDTP